MLKGAFRNILKFTPDSNSSRFQVPGFVFSEGVLRTRFSDEVLRARATLMFGLARGLASAIVIF